MIDGRILAPVHIRVKPTNRCNHHCWFCAYRADHMTLGEQMNVQDSIPPEKMMALAHEFVDMGVRAVTFSGGGEPLLYKSLPEVIEVLAAGNVRVAALTNGTNLKGRMADVFARHGTWIRLSLDAWDDDSHTESRGAAHGEFTRILEQIRAFTARDTRCVLGVSFIITHKNFLYVAEICKKLKQCGVNHVKLSGAVMSNDAAGNNAYHREIKDEVASQIESAHALADEGFTILNHYHDLEERFEKNYSFCPFLRYLTVIGADQNVYTCQDKAYTQTGRTGSIIGQTFKDFWFSDHNKKFLNNFNPMIHCGHHCVSHPKNIAIHEYLSLDQEHGLFV